MDNIFSRSWNITKISFDVIKKDKELLLFPLFAGIFSVLFIIAMVFPFILGKILGNFGLGIFEYAVIFLIYLGLSVIATFFNVCTVFTVKTRFEGGNATFFQSIGFAFSKIHLIFLWGLLSATVGLILKIIDNIADRIGGIGEIIVHILNSILGMIWSLITIFVVPAMVYNNLGPIEAIKKSVEVLKKTWGESLIKYIGFGLIEALIIILGIIIFAVLFLISIMFGSIAMIIVIVLGVIYVTFVILIFNVANSVFNTALYVYAENGKVAPGFDLETMQNAFKQKEKKN